MKRERQRLVAVGVFIALGLALFVLQKQKSAEQRTPSALSTPTHENPNGAPLATPDRRSPDERFNEQVQGAVTTINQPLRFWGKVVDQEGRPLGGVEVSYKARTVRSPMFAAIGTKDSYGKAATNADGAFYIDAGKGDMFGLYGFSKTGYRLAQNTKTGFAYAGSPEIHRPSAERPVVFVMYQEAAIEPLRHYEHRFDLPPDGRPAAIDLMAGKAVEGGQLRVTLWRNPVNIHRGRPFQWSAKIEVVGGGLVKADESKPFIAPTDGYEPSADYAFQPKNPDWDPDWHGGIRRMFYVRTADGMYGRVQIELDARSQPPPCALFVEGWLNPKSGSRNLEYHPHKQASAR